MTHKEQAEELVREVHDPGQAAIVHALLAVADALGDPPPPDPEVPFEQTKAGWKW